MTDYDRRASSKKPVETFTNEDEQMQSNIFEDGHGGYNVMLKDLDSGETVPFGRAHIKDLKEAVALAKKWVKVR